MTPLEELRTLLKDPPSHANWKRFTDRTSAPNWKDCWIWRGAFNRDGYGLTYLSDGHPQGKHHLANRMIALWTYGRFEKLVTDHIVCDTPACVNPLHLIPVTIAKNVLRGNSPPAKNAKQTHCIRGHELTKENCRPDKWPKRSCLICSRLGAQKRYRQLKEKNNGR